MTLKVKKEYLEAIYLRYKNATKKEKSKILDEFCLVCNLSRKHAIRLMAHGPSAPSHKPGPRPTYHKVFVQHLVRLWRATRHMCSKRLKAALPLWLKYDRHPKLDNELR